MLSRQQMVDVIRGGGSVSFNGRLITKEENLPSAASLAKTPEERASASEDLENRMRKLLEEKEALDAAPNPSSADSEDEYEDRLAAARTEWEKEAADKAEKEAAEKAAREKAESDAKAKKEADAKARADKEAADKAKADKDAEAKAKAEKEAADKAKTQGNQ